MTGNRSALTVLLAVSLACVAQPALAQPDLVQGPGMPASEMKSAAATPAAEDDSLHTARQAAWFRASAQATGERARVLAARRDARSLLAAAILWSTSQRQAGAGLFDSTPPAQETRVWFDAARAARPRDALVAWVEATDCRTLLRTDCDQAGALEFLLRSEPDNAAVHLLAMDAAVRGDDQKRAEAHWAAAASAQSYDRHTMEMGALLFHSMRGVSQPILDAALAGSLGRELALNRDATGQDLGDVSAMALWSAIALPSLQTVTVRCKPQQVQSGSALQQAQCKRIMTLLAEDQSMLISPLIGLKQMVGLTAGTAEGKDWRERLRQFQWTYENALPQLPGLGRTKNVIPADYLRWVMTEGELVAMRRLLESNGVPTLPPAGWLPTDPRSRSLVTTGREPQD